MTLFIWLFLILAPGFAVLLLIRTVRRTIQESRRRWPIVVAGAVGLALWALASYLMFLMIFGVAWGVAHERPLPSERFPEGWVVYALFAGYAALGAGLVAGLARVPKLAAPAAVNLT